MLGALGCGRRLLDKALADCAANDRHAHAVLHATKDAVKFYEKVGFVRVGAVSRFRDRADVPQLAYRHWTRRVDEVSYMMARPLSAVDDAPPPPVSRRRLSRRHALELVHTCMYGDVMAPGGATAFPDLGLTVAPKRGDAIFVRDARAPLSSAASHLDALLRRSGRLDRRLVVVNKADLVTAEQRRATAARLGDAPGGQGRRARGRGE